jgi:hypothetical protein
VIWESGKLLTAEQTKRLSHMTVEDRHLEVQLIARRLRKQAEDAQSRDGGAANTSPSPRRTPIDATPPLPGVHVRLSCEYPTMAQITDNLVYSDGVNLVATFEIFHDLHQLGRSIHLSRSQRRRRQITLRMRSRIVRCRNDRARPCAHD